jgi:hydroxyacylglutathione hydrolase
VGGDIFGLSVRGVAELMKSVSVPVHANRHEAEGLRKVTGLSASDIISHDSDDRIEIGDVRIRFLHTPGHTPGSQCFLVGNRLVSGDTLFIQACGRVDLPGGNSEQLYESLTQKLAKLPEDTILFPGHDYGDVPSSTIGEELKTNRFLRVRNLEDWIALMGP